MNFIPQGIFFAAKYDNAGTSLGPQNARLSGGSPIIQEEHNAA
jgi:hypothetical protein